MKRKLKDHSEKFLSYYKVYFENNSEGIRCIDTDEVWRKEEVSKDFWNQLEKLVERTKFINEIKEKYSEFFKKNNE